MVSSECQAREQQVSRWATGASGGWEAVGVLAFVLLLCPPIQVANPRHLVHSCPCPESDILS